MKKVYLIFLNTIPVLLMIGLIPLDEILILVAGFFIMIIAESIFISTGVEVFARHSLFGIMPLWLPVLWAYGYVAIKRGVEILAR